MRTVTGGETTVLQSAHYGTFARVLVEDADGTYQDLTNQDSIDWVQSGSIVQSIDQIVATGQFTFWRSQEGGNSLAPLDEDSTLNRDALDAYAPLIDVGRGIRCEFATVSIGSSPIGGDWKRVFDGVIDQWTVENDFVGVQARDAIGAEIADRWIEEEFEFGTSEGRAIEDVMQDILTEFGTLTLYTPSSPGFLVTTYRQQRSSLMDALQQLAALIGWVVQPRWDNGTSAFRLTFYDPVRAPGGTDWTWAADRYEAVPDFTLSRLDVRNAISLWYTDATNVRSQVTAEDASSIAKYKRQWMEIEEAEDSPIDTSAEAQAMIDDALLDLKDPIAGQEIKTMSFWPIQVNDYYQFTANDVHYTANQSFGVTGFRHEFSGGHVDTFIRTRGSPAGFIKPWIKRSAPDLTPEEKRFAQGLHEVRVLHDTPTDGKVTVRWTRGSKVFSVWAYTTTLPQPIDDTDDPWPDDTTLPTKVLERGTDEIELTVPSGNEVLFLQIEPRADDGDAGNPFRIQIDPKEPSELIPEIIVKEVRTLGTSVVTIDVSDLALRVTAIEYKMREGKEGGDPLDTSWQTAWTSSVGTIGVDTALQRVINVPVAAGLEGELQWRVRFDDIDGTEQIVGDSFKVVNLEAASTTLMMTFADILMGSDTTSWSISDLDGYMRPKGLASQGFTGTMKLPPGVTVTRITMVGYRNGTSDFCQVGFRKVTTLQTTATTIIATLTHDTTGWQAKTGTVSELIAADTIYYFTVTLDARTIQTHARFRGFKVDYDRPSYSKTI